MTAGSLEGRVVVVTAGGTREPIDPVRYLGNRSSGRMGNAIAATAAERGANVRLVTTVDAPDGHDIAVRHVDTAAEMAAQVRDALAGATVLVMAAAVADYRPAHPAERKLPKAESPAALELVPTVDILRSLRDDPLRDGVFVVGFAAETDDVIAKASRKLTEKGLDLIVVNDVSRSDIGMGSDHNEVTVLDSDGVVAELTRRPKREVADALFDIVEARLTEPRGRGGRR